MQHGATERCEPREQGVHRLADCWVLLPFVDEYLIETKRKMATDLLLSIGSSGSVPMRLLSHDWVCRADEYAAAPCHGGGVRLQQGCDRLLAAHCHHQDDGAHLPLAEKDYERIVQQRVMPALLPSFVMNLRVMRTLDLQALGST